MNILHLIILYLLHSQLLVESLAWLPPQSSRHCGCSVAVFRGRGIPYVETFEEQTTRSLWETDPFDTAKSVIDSILVENSNTLLLIKEDLHVSNDSGYEHLFDVIYTDHAPPKDNTLYQDLIAKNVTNDPRRHFLLRIAYRGSDFCGWQTQPNNDQLPSVQQTLEEWLQTLEKEKVDVRVCGRTDAGVHAIGQVARYRSRNQELQSKDVEEHLSRLPLASNTGGLKCLEVLPVTKSFHPSFAAKSRAYVYLIDAKHLHNPSRVATALNTQLQSLQGRTLDYIALSYGRLKTQTSLCTLHHAKCELVHDVKSGNLALCIELVGDRFLRRMVRMLVENGLRIAVRPSRQPETALLQHLESRDRGRSGNAAPPCGLIFVGATFENPTQKLLQ